MTSSIQKQFLHNVAAGFVGLVKGIGNYPKVTAVAAMAIMTFKLFTVLDDNQSLNNKRADLLIEREVVRRIDSRDRAIETEADDEITAKKAVLNKLKTENSEKSDEMIKRNKKIEGLKPRAAIAQAKWNDASPLQRAATEAVFNSMETVESTGFWNFSGVAAREVSLVFVAAIQF